MIRRIFLAIPAPPEIHHYLQILKEENQNIPGIKWMKGHNLHLTMYFIGNIESDHFEKIIELITPVLNSTKKFSFQFEKICFAPTDKPKMIWARYHRIKAFTELSGSIHDALAPVIPPSKFHYKEPIPHITLARFHPIKELKQFHFPDPDLKKDISVPEIKLFESISTPDGVRYDTVGPIFYLS